MWRIVKHQGRLYRVLYQKNHNGTWLAGVNGSFYFPNQALCPPSPNPSGPAPTQHTPIPKETTLAATMAGKILHTPVTVGQNVQQGDVVLVLETMKMEYPLQATSTAQITQIHVSEGQVVQVNQPLISLLSIST